MRETRGIDFHQVSSIYVLMVPSYDKTTKKLTTTSGNDYFHVSVVFSVCLEYFWNIFGRFLEDFWNSFGIFFGDF